MSFVIFSLVEFFILVLNHKWKIEKSRICWRIIFLDQGWNHSGVRNNERPSSWSIFGFGHSILKWQFVLFCHSKRNWIRAWLALMIRCIPKTSTDLNFEDFSIQNSALFNPLDISTLIYYVWIYLYKPSKVVCSTICLIFDLYN